MNLENKTELPKDRFNKVLEILKIKGITQRNIVDELNLKFMRDESYISSIKSGKRKKIPNELIDALHKTYNINPAYIRLESNYPFDITGTKLEHFEKFVDDWDVVEKEGDKYLHFKMDRNFYDFLIETYTVKEVTEEGISTYENEINTLKELYSGTPCPEEFVLIPRNKFHDIVQDSVKKNKSIYELISFLEHKSYIKEDKLTFPRDIEEESKKVKFLNNDNKKLKIKISKKESEQ